MKQVRSFYESPDTGVFLIRIERSLLTSIEVQSNQLTDYNLLGTEDIEWD